MKIKLSTFVRKARAEVKNSPTGRRLEQEKLNTMKLVTAGKRSQQWGSDIKRLLRVRRQRLLNREMYRLLKLETAIAHTAEAVWDFAKTSTAPSAGRRKTKI